MTLVIKCLYYELNSIEKDEDSKNPLDVRESDEKLSCSNMDLNNSINDLILTDSSNSVELTNVHVNHINKPSKCCFFRKINNEKEKFDDKLLNKLGIDTQTSVLIANSVITGITVSIGLVFDGDSCNFNHKISDTCKSRLITIGISLFILFL